MNGRSENYCFPLLSFIFIFFFFFFFLGGGGDLESERAIYSWENSVNKKKEKISTSSIKFVQVLIFSLLSGFFYFTLPI